MGGCHQGVVVFGNHLAVVIHRYYAGVVQPPGSLRFALEAGQHPGDFGAVELRRQNGLDGDSALDHGIKPFVHHAHRAFAEFASDQVFTEFGHGRHGVSRIAAGFWTV